MSQPDPTAHLEHLLGLLDQQQQLLDQTRNTLREMAVAAPGGDDPLTMVAAVLGQLADSPDQAAAVDALLGACRRLLPDSLGSLALELDDQTLEVVAAWSPDATWLRESRGQGQAVLRALAEQAPDRALRQPLVNSGLEIGELRVWPAAERLDEQAARHCQLLARCAGLALGGLALKRRLAQRSVRDPLTGLFNRRYMEDTLAREIHRGRRNGTALGLILCDLDQLAGFNERYGTSTGDRLLQAVAGLMQASFRGSDVCCRIDGQRFAVVLPEARLPDSERRGRELVAQIGEIRLSRQGETVAGITACAGVASFPDHADSVDHMLGAVESALFLAKQAGKGEMRVAEKLG